MFSDQISFIKTAAVWPQTGGVPNKNTPNKNAQKELLGQIRTFRPNKNILKNTLGVQILKTFYLSHFIIYGL